MASCCTILISASAVTWIYLCLRPFLQGHLPLDLDLTLFFFFFFFLFTAVPKAYGSSWARGRFGATAEAYATATVPSNLRSIFNLRNNLWPCWILNWLSEARDWTCILRDKVRFLTRWATVGTPSSPYSNMTSTNYICKDSVSKSGHTLKSRVNMNLGRQGWDKKLIIRKWSEPITLSVSFQFSFFPFEYLQTWRRFLKSSFTEYAEGQMLMYSDGGLWWSY